MKAARPTPEWPVQVTALAGASAATLTWRRREQTFVTVVVKATFTLVPEGWVTPADPDPIDVEEEESGSGLRSAGDLVPHRPHAEVSLVGHADRWGGTSAESRATPPYVVRLAVLRESVQLVKKAVSLPDPRIVGLGPISRHLPARARLVGVSQLRRGADGIVELPERFDWEYFQSCPPDQWMDGLRGDEAVALAGVHRKRPVVTTRLLGAAGVARLFGRTPSLRQGWTIPLVCDSLQLDVDRETCSLLWRGQFPVSTTQAFPFLHVVAGVELPSRPVQWLDPFAVPRAPASGPNAAPRRTPPPRPAPAEEGTLTTLRAAPLSLGAPASAPAAASVDDPPTSTALMGPAPAPVSFGASAAAAASPDPLGSTATGVFDGKARAATPFDRPAARSGLPPESEESTSLMSFDALEETRRSMRVLPFGPPGSPPTLPEAPASARAPEPRPSAPDDDPLASTVSALDAHAATPALPFDRYRSEGAHDAPPSVPVPSASFVAPAFFAPVGFTAPPAPEAAPPPPMPLFGRAPPTAASEPPRAEAAAPEAATAEEPAPEKKLTPTERLAAARAARRKDK